MRTQGSSPRWAGGAGRHPGSPVPSLSAKVTASFSEGFASSKPNPWTHCYQLVLLETCVSFLSLRGINRWAESSHVKLCRDCCKLMSLLWYYKSSGNTGEQGWSEVVLIFLESLLMTLMAFPAASSMLYTRWSKIKSTDCQLLTLSVGMHFIYLPTKESSSSSSFL